MNALLVGELMHARHDAVKRAFRYPVYMAAIDLASPPTARLFSRDRFNLLSVHARDYDAGDLYAANGVPVPARTVLITNPRVLGYTFNPVSFFLGYGASGIESVIAEVNNTYGGRRRYLLGPAQRLPGPRVGFRHVRELFVSPFLHGDLTYDFWFDDGDPLVIEMHVTDRDARRVFTAKLTGQRRPLTDRAIAAAVLRNPLMTAQVIGLIHWQALKLRLAGAPYHRPAPGHAPRP